MFDKIKGINFKKPGDECIRSFDFFDKPYNCGCFIYGNNGSGKSSIAKWFRNYKALIEESDNEYIYDFHNQAISLSSDKLKSIHIFDEEFIENNIKVDEDGINSIVILGESVQLNLDIQCIKRIIEKRNKIKDNISNTIDTYTKDLTILDEKLKGILQRKWAERNRRILKNQRRSSVNDTVISTIRKLTINSEYNYDNKLGEFYEALIAFESIEANSTKISEVFINYPSINENKLYELLARSIEHIELSERETYLLSLVGKETGFSLEEINNEFSNNEVEVCPFCLQPIAEEYKKDLCNSIKHILTKEVEDFQYELQSYITQGIEINLTEAASIDIGITNQLQNKIEEFNSKLLTLNQYIESKIANPYEVCNFESKNINNLINEIKPIITQLNQKIKLYNSQVDNQEQTRNSLIKLNYELARIEVNSCINNIKVKTKIVHKLRNSYSKFISSLEILEKKKEKLIAEQANIKIAVTTINSYLKTIFFNNNRLQIEELNGKYILKVNGLKVKPKNISTGERNIIALCYFFTTLGEGLSQSDRYTSPTFVIIDDPISSFDFNNKLGLTNLLRVEIQRILELSEFKSRIILLTHDLQVISDLERFLKRFDGYEVLYKELSKGKLDICNISSRHEYSTLLKEVYKFASNMDINEFIVGNSLRRILEFYCTFLYKLGIEDVLKNNAILDRIGDETKIEFFRQSIYKLVWNGYSHTYDSARNISPVEFLYSVDECRSVVQAVIGFMYLLDSQHVLAHLCDNNEERRKHIKSVIEGWIDGFTCENAQSTN